MDFKELGEQLRQQREEQGWSLEEIYQKIKISPSCLRNIEQGILDDLPHPVYVKGFIKNYAYFLGLDSDRLSQEFAQSMALHEDEEEEGVDPDPVLTRNSQRSRFWRLLSIIVIILLLLLLGYLVYDLFLRSPAGQQSQEKTATEEQESSGGGQDSTKGQDAAQTEVKLEFEPLPVPSQTKQEETVAMLPEDSAAQEPEEQTQEDSASSDLQAQELPEGQEQAQILEVSATEACWLQAVVDEETRELYLRPGESVSFKFWEELQLKLGNAGGVQLFFNDQEYPLQAQSGEVMEISFP
ncbi:MAG: helix-turn-helix domain-containing protein [Thermodesulfobacteriota bacterium]